MNYPTEGIVVLLLEDKEEEKNQFLDILKASLINVTTVFTAATFKDAEAILAAQMPDIIFSSIMPQEGNNDGFINKLKELTILIPLVTLSNEADDGFSLKSLSLGADDHLFKNELSGAVLRKTIQYSIERKKNNEQLREAIERFNLIAKATNDIAWDWNINKRSAYWIGNGIRNNLKFPHAEMTVETDFWEAHLHPDDKDRVIHKLNEIFKDAKVNTWEEEYRFKNNEGEYRNIFDRGFIIYKYGVPVRMLGMMEDISTKIQLEKKLEIEKLIRQKQLTEAVITAQEKERTEIGKELHDNVNQLLSASRLYIDAATNDSLNTNFLLSQASSFIKNAIEEIRSLSKVLHTPLISELGLTDSIYNLAEEIMAVNELNINIMADNFMEETLNESFKLTLYRIVQEQLTNILKHAKATDADIIISNNQDFVVLQITDNGIGFDTTKKRQGIGISNIHSRVSMYNGTMNIDSIPLKGSTLSVRFSVNELQTHSQYTTTIMNNR